jgi:phenylalanyl-tRNA synthetase beta chain
MGGQISEVSDKTTRVLMEMATWVGPNILETSKRLGLRSEASARFEKQLHPDQAIAAQRLAARLMVELCGARMLPGTIDVYPEPVPPRTVGLRSARVEKLLGEKIPVEESAAILTRLGFDVPAPADEMEVGVPGFRDADVQREADLIEEVARIYGLDKLPTTLPAREGAVGRLTPSQRLRRRIEDSLRDRGLYEIVAWSFTSPETLDRLRLGNVPLLRVTNPLSEDQSVMRPLLLPALLDAARRNAAYDRGGASYFESAHVYRMAKPLDAPEGSPRGELPAAERHHVAAYVPGDFFAAKGVLEGMLESIRVPFTVEPGERPFLHPGRAASVVVGEDEQKLGWIGELHPLVARAWDLPGGAAFEVDAAALAEIPGGPYGYRPVSTFPAVTQDIAVVVDEDVPAGDIEDAVRTGGGELLERVRLFDVYRGEQVGEGSKSLALRLEFRAPDRTLTDDEVAQVRGQIERQLAELGGKLRG